MAKKYVVAPGFAFTSHGINYGPGDEVSEKIFVDKSSFLGHVNSKKIIEAPEKAEDTAAKAAPEAKADADANVLEAKKSLAAAEAALAELTA